MANIMNCVTLGEDEIAFNMDLNIVIDNVQITGVHLTICDPNDLNDVLDGELDVEDVSYGDMGISWDTAGMTKERINEVMNDFYAGDNSDTLMRAVEAAFVKAGMSPEDAQNMCETTEGGMQEEGRVSYEGAALSRYFIEKLKGSN